MTTLIEALRNGRQIDEDGVEVAVSREAVCTAADELDRQAKEIEGVMWLEQQHWDKDELFELVNNWKTKDGTRHPQGLAAAIDAAIAQQKETR